MPCRITATTPADAQTPVPKPETRNPKPIRWRIAAAAILLHLCIGSVYAYSVLIGPLADLHRWTKPQTAWAFSLAIVFLGLSAAVVGPVVARRGARWAAAVSALCQVAGLLGTAAAVHLGSLPLFYLAYGVVGGIGLGFGYLAPVALLVRSFPERRGLATGMAIMGFGLGALVFGPVMAALFPVMGVAATFLLLAAVQAVLMGGAALALVAPPAPVAVAAATAAPWTTGRFWALWAMLFLNVTCGIALISQAAPLLQEQAGLSLAAATAVVGLVGLFNGGGRLGWSALSDRIGRPAVWAVIFALGAACCGVMALAPGPLLFQVAFLLAITAYGGGFACMPSFIADLFGVERLPRVQGLVLTAWSAAGIAGPLLAATLRERTGSYAAMLPVFAVVLLAGLAVVLVLRARTGRVAGLA
ncbi:MAG: hypothetical protein RLZZ127_1158 [Planctomycetota bacterium]|jgi:OFA family oxalate/formate antiporter-like MFS transporter